MTGATAMGIAPNNGRLGSKFVALKTNKQSDNLKDGWYPWFSRTSYAITLKMNQRFCFSST